MAMSVETGRSRLRASTMAIATIVAAIPPSSVLTANSALPASAEVVAVLSSGSETIPPRRTKPRNARPSPVRSAIASTFRVRCVPAIHTTTAAARKTTMLSQSG